MPDVLLADPAFSSPNPHMLRNKQKPDWCFEQLRYGLFR
jgi:hypothetical protein